MEKLPTLTVPPTEVTLQMNYSKLTEKPSPIWINYKGQLAGNPGRKVVRLVPSFAMQTVVAGS